MAKAPNFDDRESFEAWLNSFDDETTLAYAKVLSGRVALRVVPFLARIWGSEVKQETKSDLTLHSLRANLISVAACKYPTAENTSAARSAVLSALSAGSDAGSAAVSGSSVAYAVSSSVIRSAAFSAFSAAFSAADSADSAADSAAVSVAIWESVREDARALLGGMDVEKLETQRLWLGNVPEWFVKERNDFRRALKTDGPHWDFWLDWYAAKVAGEPMDRLGIQGEDFIGQKLAEQDGAFWDRGPKAVSADIEAWIADYKLKIALKNLQERIEEDEVKTWLFSPERLLLNVEVAKENIDVVDDLIAQQRYEGIQRKTQEFEPIVGEIVDIHGWDDFSSHFKRLQCLLQKPLDEVVAELGFLYDSSLEFAAFLDQDNDLRKTGPQGNKTQLDAYRRRKLETLILALGPWLRMFPSLQRADDEAGKYFQRMNERQNALRVAEAARNSTAISALDHSLLNDLLTALDRLSGSLDSESVYLSQKASHRGASKVKSLVAYGMMGLAGFISGGAASSVSEDSILMNKLGQAFLDSENAIVELYQSEPIDMRNAVTIMLDRLKHEREKSDSDEFLHIASSREEEEE